MNELVFRGYLRPNGQARVRNIVLVLHTVNCSRHVAAKICAQAREEGIPAELIGNGTCFDEQTVINRMLRLIAHGNVGAAAQAVCAFGAALLEQGGSVLISGSGGQPEQQTGIQRQAPHRRACGARWTRPRSSMPATALRRR